MANQELALRGQRSERLPLSKKEIMDELMGCLTLVRPVGMSEDMAAEWLAVGAMELIGADRVSLKGACREARQTCTHHGQIIPAILRFMVDAEKPDPFVEFARQHDADARAYLGIAGKIEGRTEAQNLIQGAAHALRVRK